MRNLFISFCLLLAALTAESQQMKIKWSETMTFKAKSTGFGHNVVGYNSQYIYVKMAGHPGSSRKIKFHEKESIRIVGYDRATLKPKLKEDLKGFGRLKKDKKTKDLIYRKTIVTEDFVYVFWSRREGNRDITYAQTFDPTLKKVAKLKKVYSVLVPRRNQLQSGVFILHHPNQPNKIVIGHEEARDNTQNVKVECRVLDSQLTFNESVKFELPLRKMVERTNQLSSSYRLGDDGLVYVSSYVSLEEDKEKSIYKYFTVLSVVDPTSGEIVSTPLRYEDKSIKNVHMEVENGEVHISGVYFERVKKKKYEPKGLYFATYSVEDKELKSSQFSGFDVGFVDEVRSQIAAGEDANRAARKQGELNFSDLDDLVVEKIERLPNGDKLLIMTVRDSYIVSSCNGQGQCSVSYNCDKSSVIVTRVNEKNEIIKTLAIPRYIHYPALEIEDIECAKIDQDKYLVTFGSGSITVVEKGKTKVVPNSGKRGYYCEYAILDIGAETFEKFSEKINPDGTKKKESKYFNANSIFNVDDKLYVYSRRTYLNTGGKLVLFPGGLFIYPLFFLGKPGLTTGHGNLGEIYIN